MKKNYILIVILLLTTVAFANHGKDSTTVAKKTRTFKTHPVPALLKPNVATSVVSKTWQLRSFKSLDAQLDVNFFSLNNQSQKITKEYMQNLVVRDSVINTQLSEVIGTMDVLEENGQTNGGAYTVKSKSLGQGSVYEDQPVINLNNKEYVKINDNFIANNPNKTRVQLTTDINTQGFNTWKLANAGSGLLKRFDDLGLSSLITKLDDLTSAQKTKFLDAFATAGKEIDHKMTTTINSLGDTFSNVNHSATLPDLDIKWANRQSAVTKQEKIVASELLAKARVDQIYQSRGWQRLDVDRIPPGKQGRFDRVYAEFDSDGDLVNLHVVEAKGGGSTLGARTTQNGNVAQQGTTQYRDNIIDNLKQKLPNGDPLKEALIEASDDNLLKYILVSQKTDSKLNFTIKNFIN